MPGQHQSNQDSGLIQRQSVKEPVLLQGDFRKVSGISSEIFRQIEAVENDHDPSTAAALEVTLSWFCVVFNFNKLSINSCPLFLIETSRSRGEVK